MLHECAAACAECDHGITRSGAMCDACAPIREAERRARADCTPVMDLDVDARLWAALQAAIIRSPRMADSFRDGLRLELAVGDLITWLDQSPSPGEPTLARVRSTSMVTYDPAAVARYEQLTREVPAGMIGGKLQGRNPQAAVGSSDHSIA